MPILTNPETGEEIEVSVEEMMEMMRNGRCSIQQVVKHADGSTTSSALYGNVFADGIDRSVNIFASTSDINYPAIMAARKVKEANPDAIDIFVMDNSDSGYEITVDDTEQPIMHVMKCTKENATISRYIRDERKTIGKSIDEAVVNFIDGKIERSLEDIQNNIILLFLFGIYETRKILKERGLLQELQALANRGSGVIVTTDEENVYTRLVRGRNRPDLPCMILGGLFAQGLEDAEMMRPYMDEMFSDMLMGGMSPEEMISAAEAGDPDIMEHLAQAYLNGDDEFEQDFEKSTYWWEKLASTGNAIGQFNTGLHYAKGAGVERDFAKAAEWMRLAAENGDEDAPEVAALYAGAAEMLKKAEAGDADAQAEAATFYMRIGGSLYQYGSDDDYAAAFAWAQKAAVQGSLEGMYCLALCYEHGRGTMVNTKLAADTYEKAARAGHAPSQWNYAVCYFNGIGREIDWTTAYTWAYQSADQSYELAIENLRLQGKTLAQVIETYKNPQSEIKLERTQYNGRADRCENLRAGTKLTYEFAEENNHEVLELFHKNASVGVLHFGPFSEVIALLKLDKIELDVSVLKCIPKSQRGNRARSADVNLLLEIREKKPETAEEQAIRLAKEEAQRKAEEERIKAEQIRKEKEAEELRRKALREAEEKESRKKQAMFLEEEKVRQEKINFCKEYAAWKEKSKEINKLRNEEIERSISTERAARNKIIEDNYAAALKRASEKKLSCMKKKTAAEAELSTLGTFKFAEKRATKAIIKEMSAGIIAAETEIIQAERNYNDSKTQLQARLDSERKRIMHQAEKKHPMPERPIKPYYINDSGVVTSPRLIENQQLCRSILKFLSSGGRYSVFELFESMEKARHFPSDMTPQRLSQLVTKLVDAGRLSRITENRNVYIIFNEAGEKPEPGWENGDSAENIAGSQSSNQATQTARSHTQKANVETGKVTGKKEEARNAPPPRSAPSSPGSLRQLENEKIMEDIVRFMSPERRYSVWELLEEMNTLPSDMTPQRMSSLLTRLVEDGKLSRFIENRAAYFSVK